MSTQRFITQLARTTDHTEQHGSVVACHRSEGGVVGKGSYTWKPLFITEFEDGSMKTFHMLASTPKEIRK